jgi:hypothetical protein
MKLIYQLLMCLFLTSQLFPQEKRHGVLPFVNDSGRVKFAPSIKWGAAIGISSFRNKISGITELKQRLAINHLNSNENSAIPIMFGGFLEWRSYSFEFEYAFNSNYTKISIGANYLFKDIVNVYLTPYAGISLSSLKFTRYYESGDSMEVNPGYKSQLLGIVLNNNTLGYNILVGMKINYHLASLSLSAGHTWVSKKRGRGEAGMLMIDLSGFYFETMFKICFGEY